MFVRNVMTLNPVTITAKDSLQDAMELMAMKHIRHLPVLDETGALIGLVTDRDLRRVAPSPLFPTPDPQYALDSTTVERVMVKAVTTVVADAPLKDAVKLLVDHKFGALPVMANGKLVGILTPVDVMRAWLKSN